MKIQTVISETARQNMPKLVEVECFGIDRGNRFERRDMPVYEYIATKILGYSPISCQQRDIIHCIAMFPNSPILLESKGEAETIKMLEEVAIHFDSYNVYPKNKG